MCSAKIGEAFGAATAYGKVGSIRQHKTSWRMLPTLAEQVVDLQHETLQ
jgi:hypothetical protein